jgi:hypothetical protein
VSDKIIEQPVGILFETFLDHNVVFQKFRLCLVDGDEFGLVFDALDQTLVLERRETLAE